jgi:probable phosphoglycerate mutase
LSVAAPTGPLGVIAPHTAIVVRHGNTFGPGDVIRRVGARTDLALVASGVRQAEALGAHFRDVGLRFASAFCSPLRRTRETAQTILQAMAHAPPLQVASVLTEIDHGPDENQPEDQVLARLGEHALRQWDEAAIPPPGWAVDPAAVAAAWRAFHAEAMPGETRLVVTSNGAARFVLGACGFGTMAKLRTGAFGRIDFLPDGGVSLVAWDERPA